MTSSDQDGVSLSQAAQLKQEGMSITMSLAFVTSWGRCLGTRCVGCCEPVALMHDGLKSDCSPVTVSDDKQIAEEH